MKRALILIAIAACSKKAPSTGSRELDAFEAAYGTFKEDLRRDARQTEGIEGRHRRDLHARASRQDQQYVATLGAVCAAKYGHIRFSSMKELSIDPKISPRKGTGD